MRKIALVLIAPAIALTLAAPARAALPADGPVHRSEGAWASWFTREALSATSWRETSTYVSAYRSADGVFVNVSRGIFTCTENATPPSDPRPKPSPEYATCTGTWADGSTDGGFVVDRRLDGATVKAIVPLRSWDQDGNSVGGPVPTTVVAQWTGTGRIDRNSYHSSFCDGLSCYLDVFTSSYRRATAAGTIGDVELGDTGDASLSSDRSVNVAT